MHQNKIHLSLLLVLSYAIADASKTSIPSPLKVAVLSGVTSSRYSSAREQFGRDGGGKEEVSKSVLTTFLFKAEHTIMQACTKSTPSPLTSWQ